MPAIENTALSKLAAEGRLFNPVLKGDTTKPDRFGFRGDIALKFQDQVADEKRPPDYSLEQVLTITDGSGNTIPVLAGYIHSFEYLKPVTEVLGGLLAPGGKYILFCNNIDFLKKYKVTMNGVDFIVLPLDESTVWKEMLDLLGIDKNDIKKLDTAGKLDYVMDVAKSFEVRGCESLSFEDGVARMAPVRNRNENRPV